MGAILRTSGYNLLTSARGDGIAAAPSRSAVPVRPARRGHGPRPSGLHRTESLGDSRIYPGEPQSETMIKAVFEAGLAYFDTSPWCELGLAENRLGFFLRRQNRRVLIRSRGMVPRRYDLRNEASSKTIWKMIAYCTKRRSVCPTIVMLFDPRFGRGKHA